MRVGIVGVGRMGVEHLKSLALAPGVDVVALADASADRALRIAREHGVEHVFHDADALIASDEVDAVDVVVPPGEALAIVQAVCRQGKPLMCEKPLGVDAEEARAMLEAATNAGVVHALCHQRRYDPVHRYVRDLVADGFVGTPKLVDVRVMTDFGVGAADRAAWLGDATAGGGVLMQLLSHYVDLLHFTFGELAVTRCDSSDDAVVAFGALPGGGRVSLVGSWTLHHPAGVAWEIYGTEGTIRIDSEMRVIAGRAGEPLADCSSAFGDRRSMGWGDNHPMLAALAEEFAANVAGTATTEPLYATFADGLWFHEAVEG